jgi:hypothetical protein
MATAASEADRASIAILNGFGRALGDAIIGLQALHVAIRLGAVPPHPALFRLPGLPSMVEAVHAAADFARIRTLPWDFAAPERVSRPPGSTGSSISATSPSIPISGAAP